MQTIDNPIDNAGALKALVMNLYTGWGYNAYRQENKDRADDLLVRNGVCALLGETRAALRERVQALHSSIPTPSRDNPFPGAVERRQIEFIERLDKNVEAVEVRIRNLPVPENDSTWIRHRAERDFLPRLLHADEAMAQGAALAREHARNSEDFIQGVESALVTLRGAIEQRNAILMIA